MKLDFFRPFLLFTALVALAAVLVYSALQNYAPENFAEAEYKRALIPESLEHAAALNDLTEANQANVNHNAYTRRLYTTLAVMFTMAAICALVFVSASALGVQVGTWGYRVGLANLAEGRKQYQAIMHRAEWVELGDGRKVFTTPQGRLLLLDETMQIKVLADAEMETNPARIALLVAAMQAQASVEMSRRAGRAEVIR